MKLSPLGRPLSLAVLVLSLAVSRLMTGVGEPARHVRAAAPLPPLGAVVSPRSAPPAKPSDEPLSGPERERRYFDDWHGKDYGAVLPPEVVGRMTADVAALPGEPVQSISSNGWTLLGPSGIKTQDPAYYSGRILDLDWFIDAGTLYLWLAAASGGLWQYNAAAQVYTALTDALPTQAVGTVSVDPASRQNIVIGTGEYGLRAGKGIFRSTNGGSTWTPASGGPTGAVHRIRHVTSSVLVCASESGWYRSTDGGATWTRQYPGVYFDIATHPSSPDTMYTTSIYDDSTGAVWRSSNGGVSFDRGLGVANAERGAVALCRNKPWEVYAAFSKPAPSYSVSAIVVTHNSGGAWYGLPPSVDHMDGQGWYDNVIAVDPNNPQHVYVAGVYPKETLNGGATWSEVDNKSSNGLHADYHAMRWLGTTLLVGHDGGWSYSSGTTFDAQENRLPITQYTHVDAAQNNRNIVAGGAQDNGISVTTDGGASWFFRQGGDGSAVSIDPNQTSRMWSALGVYNKPLIFRRHRSTDSGVTWTYINTGIDTALTWYPDVENDQLAPVYLYTNTDRKIRKSTNFGDSWSAIATFSRNIYSLKVGRYDGALDAAVWATLDSYTAGNRVWVLSTGVFYERGGGLPAGVRIRTVIPHPVEPNTAYALVDGFDAPGQKIWRTLNRGQTWTNVTGNLPNVPLGSIVGHPTNPNELYLGTELGCFRGFQSGGQWYWITWNQGMAGATIVTDMAWVNNLGSTGQFWIIAGTYGRSMYTREVTDLDVSAVPPGTLNPPAMTLAQNTPNPVPSGAATQIAFSLAKPADASLRLFDPTGRLVATLANGHLAAGVHEFAFRPAGIVPGVYFYRLQVGGSVLSKKLIVGR